MSVNRVSQGSASIYFAGEKLEEHQLLIDGAISKGDYEGLVEKDVLVQKTVPIDLYSRPEFRKRFNFRDNGFEGVPLDQKTIEVLGLFVDMPPSDDHEPLKDIIHEQFRSFLTDWGKKKGIEFDIVIPFTHLLYRNTTKDVKYQDGGTANGQRTIGMAHIDLCKKNFSNLLIQKRDYSVKKFLAPLYWDEVIQSGEPEDFEVSEAVNLWVPLNERPTLNTLAVMDVSTINNPSEELKPYYPSLATGCMNTIQWMPYHSWVVQEDRNRRDGDAIVFKSDKIVHAGVDVEREPGLEDEDRIEYDDHRESLDGRYAFCRYKKK